MAKIESINKPQAYERIQKTGLHCYMLDFDGEYTDNPEEAKKINVTSFTGYTELTFNFDYYGLKQISKLLHFIGNKKITRIMTTYHNTGYMFRYKDVGDYKMSVSMPARRKGVKSLKCYLRSNGDLLPGYIVIRDGVMYFERMNPNVKNKDKYILNSPDYNII